VIEEEVHSPRGQIAVMGAKGAVEIIFKGHDVDEKTIEYTARQVPPTPAHAHDAHAHTHLCTQRNG
jgi:acetyl-CoA carboxylase carboxyltransferase component